MNVKVEIELPEHMVDFVESLVRDGVIGSFSEFAEYILRYRMLMESSVLSTEQKDTIIAMDKAFVRRINAPVDRQGAVEESKKLFQNIWRYADEKIQSGL